jgi:hypothetical protein
MILCRNGHENPDGATVCAVCQVPIDVDPERDSATTETTTPVESKPAATPSQPRVSLAAASLSARAGDKVATQIRVENPGGVDDSYQFQVLGESAPWAAFDPAGLSLAAGGSGTVTLTFTAPAEATGVHPYEVRTTSQQVPASPVSTVGLLEVVAPTETPKPVPETAALSAELAPQISKGSTVGEHDLTVRNESAAPVTVQPAATEGQSDVALAFEPAALTVAPGQSATAHVRVTPQRAMLVGSDRTHRFGIDVGQGVKVAGGMVQQPRVSKRVLAAAVVALLVVVGVVIGLVASGGSSSQPKVTVPDVSNRSTADAITALLSACESPCFTIGTPSLKFDSTDPGTVLATSPPAGQIVSRGSTIGLFISRGPFKISCGLPCRVGIFNSVKQVLVQQGQ